MKKFVIVCLVIFAVLTLGMITVSAVTVTLAWDANCDTSVIGYNMYYGGPSGNIRTNINSAYVDGCGTNRPAATNLYYGNYTNFVPVIGRTNTTTTVTNLIPGHQYYFAVTSRNAVGLESDFSNEVGYMLPTNIVSMNLPTAVINFRLNKVVYSATN